MTTATIRTKVTREYSGGWQARYWDHNAQIWAAIGDENKTEQGALAKARHWADVKQCELDGGHEYQPLDVIEGYPEIAEPYRELPEDLTASDHEYQGDTDVNWDFQRQIGYVCRQCGETWVADEITVGGETWVRASAQNVTSESKRPEYDPNDVMERLETDDLISLAWVVLEGGDALGYALERYADLKDMDDEYADDEEVG